MLVSNNEELIKKARFWATQSRDPAPHYQHSEIGFNYRLSNVLAAIGRGQLQVLGERVDLRRRNFAYYKAALEDLDGLTFMPEAAYGKSTHWLTAIVIDPDLARVDRENVRTVLESANVETRPVWKPMHLQPIFAGYPCYGGQISSRLFERGLCLPSGSNLSFDDLDRVIAGVRSAWRRR
jgi:pyridoxal phosphate-dependent aminotransferase EpsN